MVLGNKFFERPTLIVANDLLGKYLIRRVGGETKRFMITEVEAYDGFKDKASQKTGLWIENNPKFRNSKLEIRNYPRVGVAYAGSVWSEKKWRFKLTKGNITKLL